MELSSTVAAHEASQVHITADTIQRIFEMAQASTDVKNHQGVHYTIVPEKYNLVDLSEKVESKLYAPARKQGITHLSDLPSFMTYLADQNCQACSYIYADPEAYTLTAVFNDLKSATGWRDHRAIYKAELSREFSNWLNSNKKIKEQEDFAIFLEDNIADIAEPSGESMLAIALTMQAKTEVNFSSGRRLDNGQVQLSYVENIDARAGNGNLDIPREFSIGVRLFKNGDGYKLKARLKYRLSAGKVKFWYELDRVENAIEDAFKDYILKTKESGYTVLIGKA